jgi:hypothetical protein
LDQSLVQPPCAQDFPEVPCSITFHASDAFVPDQLGLTPSSAMLPACEPPSAPDFRPCQKQSSDLPAVLSTTSFLLPPLANDQEQQKPVEQTRQQQLLSKDLHEHAFEEMEDFLNSSSVESVSGELCNDLKELMKELDAFSISASSERPAIFT